MMKTIAVLFVLALAGCAGTATHGPERRADPAAGGGHGMAEMCKRHAAQPDRSASGPGMMDKHCKAGTAAPDGAASHVH